MEKGILNLILLVQHLNELYKNSIIVEKFWGDGAFDVLDLFNLLERHDTDSAIPHGMMLQITRMGMRRAREVEDYS